MYRPTSLTIWTYSSPTRRQRRLTCLSIKPSALSPTDYLPLKERGSQIVYTTEYHLFEEPLLVGNRQLATVSYDFLPANLARAISHPQEELNPIFESRVNTQPTGSYDLLSSSRAHLFGRSVNLFMFPRKPNPSDARLKTPPSEESDEEDKQGQEGDESEED